MVANCNFRSFPLKVLLSSSLETPKGIERAYFESPSRIKRIQNRLITIASNRINQFPQENGLGRHDAGFCLFMTSTPCLFENRHALTLRKAIDMLSGINSVSKGHQTEECSHQAWTKAKKESFTWFSYQNFGARVRQFD